MLGRSKEGLQIDDTSIVVEELTTIPRYLHGNAIGVFDVLLTKFLEHAAETVIPTLFLLGCLAWVGCAELDEQFVTYSFMSQFPRKCIAVINEKNKTQRKSRQKRLSQRTSNSNFPEVLIGTFRVVACAAS